jgi:HD-GYP domain-containing protein (c-di-GMP phosphodiesterase class II)
MKELTRCAQTQFDPQVVTVFCDLYEKIFRNLDRTSMGIP